ncbi:hypothetical protein VTH06DRAFT_5250 [Thermothelomyces fergusii]
MPGQTRPPFVRPRFRALPSDGKLVAAAAAAAAAAGEAEHSAEHIASLPDLIDFNAEHNPEHVFCLQTSAAPDRGPAAAGRVGKPAFESRAVRFRELKAAVATCAARLSNLRQRDDQGKPKTLALFLESDVGLFVHLAALLSLDVPVLLLSARLAAPSVQHLLDKTGCDTVLVSARTRPVLAGSVADHVRLQLAEPYQAFLGDGSTSTTGTTTANKVNGNIADTTDTANATNGDTNGNSNSNATTTNGYHNRHTNGHANGQGDSGNGGSAEPTATTATTTMTTRGSSGTSSLILHSSGTTGFPKPIELSARYPLVYAACHEFPEGQQVDWTNLSTLPLYHGFGLLAPCLALSTGMTCCFPPSSIIPAGRSTLALLEQFDCRSLMTVPSIVGELLDAAGLGDAEAEDGDRHDGNGTAVDRLRSLEFLAVGGGAIAPRHGARLAGAGVRVLNHYGATEIGAIAPIFRPGPDYDWRYLRLRTDLGLELRPAAEDGEAKNRWRLVGRPVGWGGRTFEIQDDLERNPAAPPGRLEVRILGRVDDVIVLKTGEKVLPQPLESALAAHPAVKTAVCLGQGQFEVVVLVEPREEAEEEGDETTRKKREEELVDAVWEAISDRINPTLDRHARVASRAAVIVKPPHKAIPRTDKGSISRRLAHEVFADEMRAAYAAVERENGGAAPSLAGGDVEAALRAMVAQVFAQPDGAAVDPDKDLFEQGMDSLQALRLARTVDAAVAGLRPDRAGGRIATAEFIYHNPSVAKLARAVRELLQERPSGGGAAAANGGSNNDAEREERGARMRSLASEFAASVTKPGPLRARVLLTGPTGGLGVQVLAQLAARADVDKIICVCRTSSAAAPSARLRAALSGVGISLSESQWDKIETVEDSHLHSDPATLARLAGLVTHIVHLAWPMDFHRTLESFEPHLRMLTTLLELGRRAHAAADYYPTPYQHEQQQQQQQQQHEQRRQKQRVRLVFASSIAAVRRHRDGPLVPERVMDDPATAAPMGYAEAKWVCEHIIASAADALRDEIEPVAVRIGQLSGPEHTGGIWKTGEHIPALVRASQQIGALPSLHGTMSWIPMDRAASALVDILFHRGALDTPLLHLENPVRQPAREVMDIIAHELGLRGPGRLLPYDEWLRRAREAGAIDSLADFFENHFRTLALGDIILDTARARRISPTLRQSGGLGADLIAKYVRDWMKQGFLAAKVQQNGA